MTKTEGTNQPLLTGPLFPLVLRFALPNMGAMLATALAAMAETRYVGSFGTSALAGMALIFPFVMLQNMLSPGAMGGGVSSAISRALGAGHQARANSLAVHAVWIGIALGIANMLFMELLGPWCLAALGGKDDALRQAIAYSEVTFLGSVFAWVLNTLASILRGCGSMKAPSVTLLMVAVIQVVIGGILGLGWGAIPSFGMQGVAAGSVLANLGGAWFLWAHLAKGQSKVTLGMRGTSIVKAELHEILHVGAVACISPFQTVLTILILTKLVASFGTQALAGYGIGNRLEFLLVPVAFAIGVASVPLVGMALGAGMVARARRAAWIAALMATAVLGSVGLLVFFVPGVWTQIYTQDAAVMQAAAEYFSWAGPTYGLFGLGLSLYFSSLGAGKALGPVLAGTLRLVVVAIGGYFLSTYQAPPWTVFALVSAGMAAYGLSTAVAVYSTPWTPLVK